MSVIKRSGSNVAVSLELQNNQKVGITSGLSTAQVSIRKVSNNRYLDNGPGTFTSVGELFVNLVHIADGLWRFTSNGGADLTEETYEIHKVIVGNQAVNTDSREDGTIPAVIDSSTIISTILADLESAHGSGSWQSATGFGDATESKQDIIIANQATSSTKLDDIKGKTDNLPETLQKNTAFPNLTFGLVLESDDVSPALLKTPLCERSLDGGAYVSMTNTPATEISDGDYKIDLSAADTNGKSIAYKFSAPGARTKKIRFIMAD